MHIPTHRHAQMALGRASLVPSLEGTSCRLWISESSLLPRGDPHGSVQCLTVPGGEEGWVLVLWQVP